MPVVLVGSTLRTARGKQISLESVVLVVIRRAIAKRRKSEFAVGAPIDSSEVMFRASNGIVARDAFPAPDASYQLPARGWAEHNTTYSMPAL